MKEQSFPFRRGARNFARLVAFLSAIPEETEVMVTIGPVKKDRSDLQNRALYGVAYKTLSQFTGYTDPELHEMFLRSYFGEVEKEVFGTKIVKPRRTTTTDENGKRKLLSTDEFSAFYSHIQQKGAEIGCYVPDPDPEWHARKDWTRRKVA